MYTKEEAVSILNTLAEKCQGVFPNKAYYANRATALKDWCQQNFTTTHDNDPTIAQLLIEAEHLTTQQIGKNTPVSLYESTIHNLFTKFENKLGLSDS